MIWENQVAIISGTGNPEDYIINSPGLLKEMFLGLSLEFPLQML